jgi:hypothetical protein
MCIAKLETPMKDIVTVKFARKRQLEIWVEMERNLHNKEYKILHIQEDINHG